jgi:hypothetical protein
LKIVQNCENIDHNKKLNNLNKFDDIDENDNKDKNNQSQQLICDKLMVRHIQNKNYKEDKEKNQSNVLKFWIQNNQNNKVNDDI